MSVDTSKFTYTITKNGQQVGGEYTANVTASQNNDNNNHNYNLTATLPKLNKGESCQIKYKYYYDTSLCDSGNESQASNKVTGESINKKSNEKVIDTSSSIIKYKRDDLDKIGTASPKQCSNYIIKLSHISCKVNCSFQKRRRNVSQRHLSRWQCMKPVNLKEIILIVLFISICFIKTDSMFLFIKQKVCQSN